MIQILFHGSINNFCGNVIREWTDLIPDSDANAFEDVPGHPMVSADDGILEIPDHPGHGFPLNAVALASFRL